MGTLKTLVVAASLLFSAVSAHAANYPSEIPDLTKAPIQFVCETKTLWFIKLYLNENWRAFIVGHDKKEMILTIITMRGINAFVFIPSIGEWKNTRNLTAQENAEFEKFFGPDPTDEDNQTLQSCVESNLRSRRFHQ